MLSPRVPVSGLAAGKSPRRMHPAAVPVRAAATRHPQSAVGPTHWQTTPEEQQPAVDVPTEAEPGKAPAAPTAAAAAAAPAARNSGTFRFWLDERRFKGGGERCLVQQALFDAGGIRTGGYPKTAPCAGPLGWQRTSDWDLLWSPARTALKAASTLRAGQIISAIPGMFCITKKRRLSVTLSAAYGDGAWSIMPLTFSLPAQLPAWGQWLEQAAAAGQDPGPWMLKTAQHLGKGLVLLPGAQAMEVARGPRGAGAKPFVVAQRYVADPLLVEGRKFGIRLWVLVTSVNPLRAYVHTRGLVLFSTHSYDSESLSDAEGGAGLGHVTNYAQNAHGRVWDLEQFAQHLGEDAWQSLWDTLVRHCALVAAAGLGEMRAEAAQLKLSPTSAFELLGFDFLVDSSLHPWLLEVNGTPSLAVDHQDQVTQELIRLQKATMVNDMVNILGCSSRFAPRYQLLKEATYLTVAAAAGEEGEGGGGVRGGGNSSGSRQRIVKLKQRLAGRDLVAMERALYRELGAAGGFLPLMPYLPVGRGAGVEGAGGGGCAVAFSSADQLLAQQMAAWAAKGQQQQQQQGGVVPPQQQQHKQQPGADGGLPQQQPQGQQQATAAQEQQQQPTGSVSSQQQPAVATAAAAGGAMHELQTGGNGSHSNSSSSEGSSQATTASPTREASKRRRQVG